MKPRAVLIFLVLIVGTGVGLRAWRLDSTFANNRAGFNGACYWGQFAANYDRYGFADSRGAPFLIRLDTDQETKVDYYVRHPFAISVLAGLSFKIFGKEEWAARGVPFLFMLGVLVLAYPLARRLLTRPGALAFTLLIAVLPMSVVYGQQLNSEGPILFFLFLMLFPYLDYRRSGNPKKLGLALLAYFPATLFDWPAFLIGPLLMLDAYLLGRRRGPSSLLGPLTLGALPFVSASLHFLYTVFVFGTLNAAFEHLSRAARSATGFTRLGDWLQAQWDFLNEYYTLAALVVASLGTLIAIITRFQRRKEPILLLPFFWLLGIAVVLAFFQRSIDHDYYSFYYVPAVALAGGVTIDFLARLCSERMKTPIVAALLLVLAIFPVTRSAQLLAQWPSDEIDALLEDPWIAAHTEPGDALIVIDPIFSYLMFYRECPTIVRAIQGAQLARYRDLLLSTVDEDGSLLYLVPHPPRPRLRVIENQLQVFESTTIELTLPTFQKRGLRQKSYTVYDLKRIRQ